MILRKPYAFLIKHFKFIHLLLSVFMAFLLYKTYNVYEFLNNYLIEAKFNIIENIANKYITIFMYISVFAVIAITLAVLLLMNFKKKPVKYYFISLLTYLLIIFIFIFTANQLKQIEWNEIDIQLIKITRDILLVTFLVQIPFLIFTLIRTTGFNIKKFNFDKDLKELAINDVDSEEFEVKLQLDANDIKTSIRRRIRIAKYIIRENKYILIAFVAVIMIVTGITFYINDEVYNKVYEEQETLNTSSFQMKVLNSYQLNTNTSNNDITDGQYNFVVIQTLLTNKTNNNISLFLDNFRIRTGKFTTYKIDTDNYNHFVEFGNGYKEDLIPANTSKEYMLVFKINKEEQNNKKTLEYLTGARNKNGELILNYAKFDLKPKLLDKTKLITTASLNEQIEFTNSLLKKSSIIVESVEFNNNFTVPIKKCISNKCYDTNTYIVPNPTSKYQKIVMKIKYNLSLDNSINTKDISNKFISRFANLRYTIDDKEYKHNINLIDITPTGVDDYSYLEVKEEVKNATNIYLDFKIRDKIYSYKIK